MTCLSYHYIIFILLCETEKPAKKAFNRVKLTVDNVSQHYFKVYSY